MSIIDYGSLFIHCSSLCRESKLAAITASPTPSHLVYPGRTAGLVSQTTFLRTHLFCIPICHGETFQQVWEDVFITETGLGYQGEVLMMLDSESRVVCPWHPTHEMALADLHTKPGIGLAYLPLVAFQLSLVVCTRWSSPFKLTM